jgi:serine/threonine-protein kinase
MLSPGHTIANKLRIVRRLGEGGMGVVYEAVQLHLNRRVAIKVIHPNEATSHEARTRFRREARALACLPLDHIVQVLDFDSLPDGALYTVMEFLDGRDLKRELKKRGALPVAEACAYVAQACRGAAVAHAAGIVHRDLKPRNIFLTHLEGERRVKLLDFGVAKFLESSGPELTSASVVLGTPTHLAPEQLEGDREVDGRADVWALGVVLFELLTCQTPFRRETTLGTLAAVAKDAPPPVASLRPDVPPGLARIIERCLEKAPSARFQTADALGEALLPHALSFAGTVRPSQRALRGSSAPPPTNAALPERSAGAPRSIPTVAMPGGTKLPLDSIPEVRISISVPPTKVSADSDLEAPATLNASTSDSPPPTPSRWPLVAGMMLALGTAALVLTLRKQGMPTVSASASHAGPTTSGASPRPPVAPAAPAPALAPEAGAGSLAGPPTAAGSAKTHPSSPAPPRLPRQRASGEAKPAATASSTGSPASTGVSDAVPLHL